MNYLKPIAMLTACVTVNLAVLVAAPPQNWPAFRGPAATGIAEGYTLPTVWNATANSPKSQGVLWRTPVPGLGLVLTFPQWVVRMLWPYVMLIAIG